MKSVLIQSFQDRIFPHSDWIRENADQETLNKDTFHPVYITA